MRNLNDVFEKMLFCDYKSRKRLFAVSTFVVEYKNHLIAFGAVPEFHGYTVRVYEIESDGKHCSGDFALRGLVAHDDEAVVMARKWAKALIDEKEA